MLNISLVNPRYKHGRCYTTATTGIQFFVRDGNDHVTVYLYYQTRILWIESLDSVCEAALCVWQVLLLTIFLRRVSKIVFTIWSLTATLLPRTCIERETGNLLPPHTIFQVMNYWCRHMPELNESCAFSASPTICKGYKIAHHWEVIWAHLTLFISFHY